MKDIKVSVIVPVYNAEATLKKCVDSLLSQTFPYFEVLLVDDGSKDSSGAICDEYARQDSRVKVFHKANGGVSSARQYGIDHAQGEYTIHADPDDWVESEMLAELYLKAKETDADMVICDFYENTYKGQRLISQKPSSLHHDVVLKELFGRLMGATWNKLIRRACYEKYHVHFPQELSFCEDQYACAALAKHNIKIAYLPKAFYHYYRPLDTKSLSRRYNVQTLNEDKEIRFLFNSLMHDTDFEKDIWNLKTYSMIGRAFYFGFNFFTSREFKREFGKYSRLVLNNGDMPEKVFLFASCKGLYHPTIDVLRLTLKLKHILY